MLLELKSWMCYAKSNLNFFRFLTTENNSVSTKLIFRPSCMHCICALVTLTPKIKETKKKLSNFWKTSKMMHAWFSVLLQKERTKIKKSWWWWPFFFLILLKTKNAKNKKKKKIHEKNNINGLGSWWIVNEHIEMINKESFLFFFSSLNYRWINFKNRWMCLYQ